MDTRDDRLLREVVAERFFAERPEPPRRREDSRAAQHERRRTLLLALTGSDYGADDI